VVQRVHKARIKGVYEDNGDSSGLAFLTGYSTGSGSPTINEVMRIRHEGRVGIGTASPDEKLHVFAGSAGTVTASTNADLVVENSANSGLNILTPNNQNGQILFGDPDDNDVGRLQYNHTSDYMAFYINAAERVRITNSGNLLVGKTSSGYNVDGFETHQNGETYVSRSGTPMAINRNSSDGTLLNLYKDGTTVGSIGTLASKLTIGSGATGVRFNYAGIDTIVPWDVSTGSVTNGTTSLGYSNQRFKDLYLSGGVYVGGTGSANYLDDYEEVSFTATLGGSGGQPGTPITVTGFATKIGRVVQYSIGFENLNTTGYSGQINITGLPFANAGGRAMGNFVGYVGATWTGNDNFTELGVGQTVLNVYTIGSASPWTGTTHNAGLHSRYFWATGTYITT
jgi:hypothetical protein